MALAQLVALPDTPGQLPQPPPMPISAHSSEKASGAASALFLLGVSFLRRGGIPPAIACLERALLLLQSSDGRRRHSADLQALHLSSFHLLGVAKGMQVLNVSPGIAPSQVRGQLKDWVVKLCCH